MKLATVTSLLRSQNEDELLRQIVPRTYATDDSWKDWGLPGAIEERRKARRERLYRFCFWLLIPFVLFWIGFAVGRAVI